MKPTHSNLLPSLCGALVLTSCLANLGPRPSPDRESATSSTSNLYARDGSLVAADPGAPTRDVGAHEGSRVYLLELYQKTVAEKDALGLEVVALRAELEREKHAGSDGVKSLDDVAAKLTAAAKERDALAAENLDLAARLTTAQILRLEAEKALLELQIEQRSRETAARGNAKPKLEKP